MSSKVVFPFGLTYFAPVLAIHGLLLISQLQQLLFLGCSFIYFYDLIMKIGELTDIMLMYSRDELDSFIMRSNKPFVLFARSRE